VQSQLVNFPGAMLPGTVVSCCDSCLLLATLDTASCADAEDPLRWLEEGCCLVFAA